MLVSKVQEDAMSVRETDEVDYLYLDEPNGRPVLVVTDPLGWSPAEEGEHMELLRQKLNSQVVFAASGQIGKVWPDWTGQAPVLIEVAARYALSQRAQAFYRTAEEKLDEAGVGLRLVLMG